MTLTPSDATLAGPPPSVANKRLTKNPRLGLSPLDATLTEKGGTAQTNALSVPRPCRPGSVTGRFAWGWLWGRMG